MDFIQVVQPFLSMLLGLREWRVRRKNQGLNHVLPEIIIIFLVYIIVQSTLMCYADNDMRLIKRQAM